MSVLPCVLLCVPFSGDDEGILLPEGYLQKGDFELVQLRVQPVTLEGTRSARDFLK